MDWILIFRSCSPIGAIPFYKVELRSRTVADIFRDRCRGGRRSLRNYRSSEQTRLGILQLASLALTKAPR